MNNYSYRFTHCYLRNGNCRYSFLWYLTSVSTVIFNSTICNSSSRWAEYWLVIIRAITLLIVPKLGRIMRSEKTCSGWTVDQEDKLTDTGIKSLFDATSNRRTEREKNMFCSRMDSLSDRGALHSLFCENRY